MTLQALETLLSSSARLSKPVLCLMIGLLLWRMRVTSLVLIKDSTPIIKTGNSHLLKAICQIKSRLIHLSNTGTSSIRSNSSFVLGSRHSKSILHRVTKL
jgi:hypothetical protein